MVDVTVIQQKIYMCYIKLKRRANRRVKQPPEDALDAFGTDDAVQF